VPSLCIFEIEPPTRGVQEPEYRSRLRQELAFFNRIRSRTRSGYFWL